MVGSIKRTTPNYALRIPVFDSPGWGREVERNFDILDSALFAASGLAITSGLWTNATTYTVGERVVDPDLGGVYACLVGHTSAATGTFAADRTANPTYWEAYDTTIIWRGNWANATEYFVNDIIQDGYKFGIAIANFTSDTSYANDVSDGNIVTFFDGTGTVTDSTNAKNAAEAAQLAAENAQTASESARDTSVSAKNDAVIAKDAAEDAAAAALASETQAANTVANSTTGAVRVDVVQSHDNTEKLQGIDNLGLFDRFVRHDAAQSLSIAQKINALDNIGIPRKGYLFGLTLSNAADADHDITIAAGQASSTNINPVLIDLASAITKRLDATFAEGTGNGGMVSGESLPVSGTVHAWLGMKADGTTDVFFNNHASSGLTPTNPTDFLWRRRIGSLITDASANIRGFVQTGDEFQLTTPIQVSFTTALGTAASVFASGCPAGVKMEVIYGGYTSNASANVSIRVSDPDTTDVSVTSSTLTHNSPVASVPNAYGKARVRSNASSQVRARAGAANTTFQFNLEGWVDTRGRLA